MSNTLIFTNALLIDGTAAEPIDGATVVIADGLIQDVLSPGVQSRMSGDVIDCAGRALIPGLIDAHVHIGAVDVYFEDQARKYPSSLLAFKMAQRLRHLLDLGYTTVRDAGGTDWGFKRAVDDGLIPGPRVVISNRMLSQTGGHGDMRGRAETSSEPHDHGDFGMVFAVADGVSAVRRAVRNQVRLGADFIKVMASGGAASPTDKLHSPQYSLQELQIIVEEATAAGVYVAAHALPPIAIQRAVQAGARTIEHGNFLDDESASQMVAAGAFLVPTVATYVMASRHPERYDYPAEITEKVNSAADGALNALEVAARNGVKIGSGSDLLGEEISWLNHELELKAEVLGAHQALRCATGNNAELLDREDIGLIQPGRRADMVCVDGNPINDISLLGRQEAIAVVLKDGKIHRKTL